MKLKSALWAVPCALALSAPAYALPPTATPDYEIWLSGASASDNFIGNLLEQLCVAGTLDTFFDDSSQPGRAQRAFFCTIDDTQVPGLSTVQPDVLIHKRSAGGSALGVRPVCDKIPAGGAEAQIEFLEIDGDCVDQGDDTWLCPPGDTVLQHPDGGVSDVGPSEFAAGLESNNCDSVNSSFGLVFGIVANLRLRDALQNAQGLTPGDDTSAANVPSLSTNDIRSLLVGNIGTWDKLTYNGNGLDTFATGLSTNTVKICRRVPTSGTQTQSQLVFLRSGCAAGVLGPLGAPGNPFGGPVVVENSGSGDVDQCMNDAQAAGEMAIGIQSTERNANFEDDYRHVRIDGILPTINNAAAGLYSDWVVSTIQWKFPFVDDGSRDDITAILETLAANAASPAQVAQANNDLDDTVHFWGQGGSLALAENGCTADSVFDISNPCTPYNRTPGTSPNNCAGPYLGEGETQPSRPSGAERLFK